MPVNYKLNWDATGERRFENGVDHGVLYPMKADGTYDKGVVWNGLTGVDESPDGAEKTDLWADNMKYGGFRSAETFGATITAYTYPDEFAACDGSKEIAQGVRIGQQTRTPFGFCYRSKIGNDVSEDAGFMLHILYGCTVSPSEKSRETINDSPDAVEFSWEMDTDPITTGIAGMKPTSVVEIDSTKADETKLNALMVILYGTAAVEADAQNNISAADAVEARLPLPDEIATLMAVTQQAGS